MSGGRAHGGVDDVDRGRRWLRRDVARAGRPGADNAERVTRRLDQLVDRSRGASPLFAELYRGVDGRDGLQALPVTDKSQLSDRFDEWCTDPAITWSAVEAFLDDRDNIGTPFLGKYLLSESSGTSGVKGTFVTEDSAVAVAAALGVRNKRLPTAAMLRLATKGARTAVIVNARGHHMGVAFYSSRTASGPDPRVRMMSVFDPVESLGEQLMEFDPACISSYASVVVLLAHEQVAGRLTIDPVMVMPFSETLTPAARAVIKRAWPRARVVDRYVANECMFISARCHRGWHHLNADWVLLEPVDGARNPVAPGTWSHSVLLTNLFRRVQPIIRYDLGDSVMVRPDPCPCGDPLPAFDVAGRSGELLYFGDDHARPVSPTVMTVVLDDIPGLTLWQVDRDSATRLTLRVTVDADHDRTAVCAAARRGLSALFADATSTPVQIDISDEPPIRGTGGKFLRVVDHSVRESSTPDVPRSREHGAPSPEGTQDAR